MRSINCYIFASIVLFFNTLSYNAHAAAVENENEESKTSSVFVAHSTKPDKLIDPSVSRTGITNLVYKDVQKLLAHAMQTWLEDKDTHLSDPQSFSKISKYFGFPANTVALIDIAMTFLLYQHRRNAIKIDNLATAFFYACDIGRVANDPGDRENRLHVVQMFENLLENLRVENAIAEGRDTLVKRLEFSIEAYMIEWILVPWSNVSITLMKNGIFVDNLTDPTVKKLMDRFTRGDAEYEDFRFGENEWNVAKVTGNHVRFIARIMPDLFGFAYNHIELLQKWRQIYKRGDCDKLITKQPIKRDVSFCVLILKAFVNRYFEFQCEPNHQLLTDLDPLLYFFDTDLTRKVYKYTVVKYMETGDLFDEHISGLINNNLSKLLEYFGNESVEDWKKNRAINIDYPDNEPNENELMELMKTNTDNAVKFIELVYKYMKF